MAVEKYLTFNDTNTNGWHGSTSNSTMKPRQTSYGSWVRVTRNTEQTLSVHLEGELINKSLPGYPGFYGSDGKVRYAIYNGSTCLTEGQITPPDNGSSHNIYNSVPLDFWFDYDNSNAITVHFYCCQYAGDNPNCSHGRSDVTIGSLAAWNLPYNPTVNPTNVSSGIVHTSKGDNAMVSASLGHDVWFDWWGQASGHPWENEINHFNVDCYKTNNRDAAYSVDVTDTYTQNTAIKASKMKEKYKMDDGDTLYCWVNTCLNSGNWLGRVYLGSFTLQNPVNVALNSCTSMVAYGNNITINYTLSDCNTKIDWTKAMIYDSTGNTLLKTVNLNNTLLTTKNANITISGSPFERGKTYKIAVRASDNWQEVESSKKSFTIQNPVDVVIDSCTQIVKVGDNLSLRYTLSDCNTSITWTKARIYNTSGTMVKEVNLNKTALGTYTSNVSTSGLTDGTQYSIAVCSNDSWQDVESSRVTFYTYRTPIISNFSLSATTFSGDSNVIAYWSTNGKRWSNLEDFKTYIEFESDSWVKEEVDSGPGATSLTTLTNKQLTITKAMLLRHIPASVLNNNDYVNTKVRMRRSNVSSGIDAVTSAISVKIYFTPTKQIKSLVFKKNNSSGATISPGSNIIISSTSDYYVSNVYVSWDYPTGLDVGVVDGYIIRIYNNAGTLIKTYTTSNKNYLVPVGDLAKAQLNKIKISAYYLRPDGSKAEGPALTSDFVKPFSELDVPLIVAPASGCNWLDKRFRVLFKLPNDPDKNYISGTYSYADIQIDVNGTVYSWSSNPEIFSSSTLSYQRYMIINPSLMNNFPSASTYTLKVRVKKNYGNNDEMWSKWSNYNRNDHKFTITADSFSVARGDLIRASHYNTLNTLCARMKLAYPLPTAYAQCGTVQVGDIIYANDYIAPFNDIKSVETAVNNYGSFDNDRSAVKFPVVPNLNPTVGEIITAEASNSTGRNYIKLLHDYANSLH